MATRKCRYQSLTKKPLVLVLVQLRFSPLVGIKDYIPSIQDQLRKVGFPLYSQWEGKSIQVGPEGVQETSSLQWRFDSATQTESVLVDSEQVLFQCSAYDRFETFWDRYRAVLKIVLTTTELERNGVATRFGLRYVDWVRLMNAGETWKDYLREPFHGMTLPSTKRKALHSTATQVATVLPGFDTPGTLVVRMSQNTEGSTLPPDLVPFAPPVERAANSTTTTLVDLDHFLVPPIPISVDLEKIETLYFAMHDDIIEALHESVLTPYAVEAWT